MRGHCTVLENVKQKIEMFNINIGMYGGKVKKNNGDFITDGH